MATSQLVTDRLVAGLEEPVYTWRRGSNQPGDDNYYLTIGDADKETTYEGFLEHVIFFADANKNMTFKGNANIENFAFAPNSIDGAFIKTGTIDGSKIKNGTTINANITGNAYTASRYLTAEGTASEKTIEQKFNEVDEDVAKTVANAKKDIQATVDGIDEKIGSLVTRETLATELKKVLLDVVYPVGAVFMSPDNENPSKKLGGTWKALGEGLCLMSAGASTPVGVGGNNSVVIGVENLPKHTHSVIVNNSDAPHGHTGQSNAAGGHTHSRGTMDIIGAFVGGGQGQTWAEGAMYNRGDNAPKTNADDGNSRNKTIGFQASRNWSGETSESGAHNHTISLQNSNATHSHTANCGETGSGKAVTINPAHFAVYMWQRTA